MVGRRLNFILTQNLEDKFRCFRFVSQYAPQEVQFGRRDEIDYSGSKYGKYKAFHTQVVLAEECIMLKKYLDKTRVLLVHTLAVHIRSYIYTSRTKRIETVHFV